MSLLDVKHLSICFNSANGGKNMAVEDVSFSLAKGEVLGIVGESGSGKTAGIRHSHDPGRA